jgi:hypothetical protein
MFSRSRWISALSVLLLIATAAYGIWSVWYDKPSGPAKVATPAGGRTI